MTSESHLQCHLMRKKIIWGKPEVVFRWCFAKKLFLEISQNSQENTCDRGSFLIKLQAGGFKKETLAQVFSCEFCEISKNTIFYRRPPVVVSGKPLGSVYNSGSNRFVCAYFYFLWAYLCALNMDSFRGFNAINSIQNRVPSNVFESSYFRQEITCGISGLTIVRKNLQSW